MRFGIGATSGMRPKVLRIRLRPVNDFVMYVPRGSNRLPRGSLGSRERSGADRPSPYFPAILSGHSNPQNRRNDSLLPLPNAKSRPARPFTGTPRLDQAAVGIESAPWPSTPLHDVAAQAPT